MKTTFILFFSGFFASAMAQPSFTSFPNLPEHEETVSKDFDYSGADPKNSAGSNQTWDFSTLDYSAVPEERDTRYGNLSTATYGSYFPEATEYYASTQDDGDRQESFYQVSSNAYMAIGYAMEDRIIKYSDPSTVYSIPFLYNEIQNDTYGYTEVDGAVEYISNATTSTAFDGYGTLIMPFRTITDVARLKRKENSTTVINFMGAPYYTFHADIVSYIWIVPGQADAILGITYAEYSDGPITSEVTAHVSIPQTTTGILKNTTATNAFIYPQPSTDQVTVMAAALEGACRVKVYNLSGDVVSETHQVAETEKLVLNVQDLSNGMYMLEIKNEDRTYRQKLVIQ